MKQVERLNAYIGAFDGPLSDSKSFQFRCREYGLNILLRVIDYAMNKLIRQIAVRLKTIKRGAVCPDSI